MKLVQSVVAPGLVFAAAMFAFAPGAAVAHTNTPAEWKAKIHLSMCGNSPAPCSHCTIHTTIPLNPLGGMWWCDAPPREPAGTSCRCKSPSGWKTGAVEVY